MKKGLQYTLALVLIPYLVFSEQKKPAPKFDSSGLKSAQDTKKSVELRSQAPANKKEKLKVDMLIDEDPTKLEKQVKALQLILKNEKDRTKKINLYLRLSYIHVSIAKKYGIKRLTGEKLNPNEKKHLDEANKIISFLLKNIENNNKALSTLYNIKGLVSYELEKVDETIQNFLKSIELNPKNPQAEVMSIFIGEYYFDQEKYNDAIKYYQLFYKRMNNSQKALADYKVAWSYLNLKEIDKAELQFVKIIREELDKGTTEDSYKDLAFILTQDKDEQTIIAKVNAFTKSPELMGKLYYYCLLFYLQSSKDQPRDRLFKEVLAIQKDMHEQLKVLALKVSFEKRDIPTKGMVAALDNFAVKIKGANPEAREKFFKSDAYQLEEDSEFNIRIHVDAYTGKLKSEENMPKNLLGELAVKQIKIHLDWFPGSKKKNILYHLWIDTCVDLKNSNCLFELETRFKAEKSTPEAFEFLKKIQIELLALYDSAYEKDHQKHQVAFIGRLKQFIEQFPNDPIALKSKKRLFGIYFSSKNFTEALPLAEQVFKLEKNNESAQKILLSLFELGKYDVILTDPVYNTFVSPEIMEIKREASLKSAMINAGKGNFENYETDIRAYLNTKPSDEKAMVVYIDYFKKLIEMNQFQKLDQEWKKLPKEMQDKKNFYPIKSSYFDKVLGEGDFYKTTSFWNYTTDKNLNEKIIINKIAMNYKLTTQDITFFIQMDNDKKNYLFNILNYVYPAETIEILKSFKTLTDSEKKILLSALLLKAGTLKMTFDPNDIKDIKNIVPEKFSKDTDLKIEKDIKNVVFPNSKMKPKVYESYVVNNVDNIKFLRNRVLKSLKTATQVQKIRVLGLMAELESKMAQSIKDSPVPEGLDEAQLKEYKTGLEEMAKDYETQGQSFSTAKLEIESQIKKQADDEEAAILPLIKLDDWSVSKNDTFAKLNQIFDTVSAKAAIIFIDNLMFSKKIQMEEYYSYKAWIILKLGASESLRKFYHDELVEAGQVALIEKWKGLKK